MVNTGLGLEHLLASLLVPRGKEEDKLQSYQDPPMAP